MRRRHTYLERCDGYHATWKFNGHNPNSMGRLRPNFAWQKRFLNCLDPVPEVKCVFLGDFLTFGCPKCANSRALDPEMSNVVNILIASRLLSSSLLTTASGTALPTTIVLAIICLAMLQPSPASGEQTMKAPRHHPNGNGWYYSNDPTW